MAPDGAVRVTVGADSAGPPVPPRDGWAATWTVDPYAGPAGVTTTPTDNTGTGTIVGAALLADGVAPSPRSASLTDAAGAPVVPDATLTVATIVPSDPALTGVVAVEVHVRVSLATVVADSPQVKPTWVVDEAANVSPVGRMAVTTGS